ncbi:hypothetical protein HWV62_44049 [Athelia sp. TMB]|nr:hypothetical protein HWV62_44049 [Athelia sp. TMB]
MRKTASRMHVLSIYDLSRDEALQALARMRRRVKEHRDTRATDKASISDAVSVVGGRLLYLNRVSKARDMVDMARHMLRVEKAWLLSQIGLIPDCDDDVMDEWRCRQIMTRPDFLEADLDRANIISIDVHHDVRPDSMLILHAARQVVEEDEFQDMLDSVRARVDEIESLHRTRELTVRFISLGWHGADSDPIYHFQFKDVGQGDRIRLSVDKGGALLVDS